MNLYVSWQILIDLEIYFNLKNFANQIDSWSLQKSIIIEKIYMLFLYTENGTNGNIVYSNHAVRRHTFGKYFPNLTTNSTRQHVLKFFKKERLKGKKQ